MQRLFDEAREVAKRYLQLAKRIFISLRKRSSTVLGLLSIAILSIIAFSFLIVSHLEYELIGGDSAVVQRSSEMVINGDEFYDGLEEKVNNFRKIILDSDAKWEKPESLIDIEIFLESVDRIDEVSKTIHMKGYIVADYLQSGIKTPFLSEGVRTLSAKKDILDLAYLNFSNVDAQSFKPVSVNSYTSDGDTWVRSRYSFEGEFPLKRDLSKFPFETAQWQIKLRVPLSAPGVFLAIDNDSFNFPSFNVDAYYFADPGCNEYLDLVCVVDQVIRKGEKVDPATFEWHLNEYDEPPSNADGIETLEAAKAWQVVDVEPVIGVEGVLRRSVGSSFFRFVFPVMAVCSLLILFENIKNTKYLELKIGAPPTVFLTLIFMQSGYQEQLPQISYITYLDKLFIIGYALSVISLSRSILAVRLVSGDRVNDNNIWIIRMRKRLKFIFYAVLFLGPWLAWIG